MTDPITFNTRLQPSAPSDWRNEYWRDYAFETSEEHAERVTASEELANEYFAKATAPQLAIFHQTMAAIAPYRKAPKWERMRADARRLYLNTTAEAVALFEFTAEEIMRDGEVSEATGDKWFDLANLNAVRCALEAAE